LVTTVRLDTAAGAAELVNIAIFGCMAGVLDKYTIVEVGTGILVSNTTVAVGVMLDTAARVAELVNIPILVDRSTCLQYH
jgi:hypothetical protein